MDKRIAEKVLDRSGGNCEICDGPAVQIHHRKPRKMGGRKNADTLANLLHLCLECHAQIESYRAEAYINGWLVREGYAPDSVPVTMRYGHALLCNNGTVSYKQDGVLDAL